MNALRPAAGAPAAWRGIWAALACAALLAVAGCAEPERQAGGEVDAPAAESLALEPVGFAAIPGFAEDRLVEALPALRRSCSAIVARPAEAPMGPPGAGVVADWTEPCRALLAAPAEEAALRLVLERWFVPMRASAGATSDGLLTGYYEPLLQGARSARGRFVHPLYRRPPDLVAFDLAAFDAQLPARRLAGRVEGGRLVPYPDRAAIDAGALRGRGLELLWVDDPVALFFLHIQGSGQVALAEGGRIRVGYADQNGRAYRAIGRDLVEAGALDPEAVSLQSIRAWLEAHPAEAPAMMARNPSYVFFRDLGPVGSAGEGPPGAQGVPLTPGRSLAVDRRMVAYGTPVWIDSEAPFPDGTAPLRRLVVAQDTGGAIRGPLRGDLFWGAGAFAEHVAGHMKSRARWYLLLPRSLAVAG